MTLFNCLNTIISKIYVNLFISDSPSQDGMNLESRKRRHDELSIGGGSAICTDDDIEIGGIPVNIESSNPYDHSHTDKRLRTTIHPEQLDYLYLKYQKDCNPSRKQLEMISADVRLKKRVVQVRQLLCDYSLLNVDNSNISLVD